MAQNILQIKRENAGFMRFYYNSGKRGLDTRRGPANLAAMSVQMNNQTPNKVPKPVTGRKALLAKLDSLGIAHTTHDHAAVFTVAEGAQIKAALAGGHTKNLFLKDKTGALFLVCALGDTQINVNHLHKTLGCKRLSFAKPDVLLEHLGVTPGSVTVFSVLNDKSGAVTLVLDKALFEHDIVNFHPMINTATTAVSSADLLIFAKAVGHPPIIVDFKALTTAAQTPS